MQFGVGVHKAVLMGPTKSENNIDKQQKIIVFYLSSFSLRKASWTPMVLHATYFIFSSKDIYLPGVLSLSTTSCRLTAINSVLRLVSTPQRLYLLA